jgi:hypothetical protein
MKRYSLFLLLLLSQRSFPQRIVLDRAHLSTVVENNAVRLSTELSHQQNLHAIHEALNAVQVNLGAVIFTEQLIFRSLAEVDQGLKSAMAVRQISALSLEIIAESRGILALAASAPHLLLFAEQTTRLMSGRGTRLATEVADLVLKERGDLLLDFGKRDALLKKISLELKTIRALLFSMKKCMYWAKAKGLLRSVNPFAGFINTDKRMVENLLLNYKTLKQK